MYIYKASLVIMVAVLSNSGVCDDSSNDCVLENIDKADTDYSANVIYDVCNKRAQKITYDTKFYDCVLDNVAKAKGKVAIDLIYSVCERKFPRIYDYERIASLQDKATWPQVINNPKTSKIPKENHLLLRDKYFDDVIRPYVGSSEQEKDKFYAYVKQYEKNVNDNLHKVVIPGCAKTIPLSLPRSFSPPSNRKQQSKENEIFGYLHSNKSRKARYTRVFMNDWSSKHNLPYILVGSLGSIINSQDHISAEDWKELKSEAMQSSSKFSLTSDSISKKLKEHGANKRVENYHIIGTFEEDDNSLVTLVELKLSVEGGESIDVYSVAKLIYYSHCIAYVNIVVPRHLDSVENVLQEYINKTHIIR